MNKLIQFILIFGISLLTSSVIVSCYTNKVKYQVEYKVIEDSVHDVYICNDTDSLVLFSNTQINFNSVKSIVKQEKYSKQLTGLVLPNIAPLMIGYVFLIPAYIFSAPFAIYDAVGSPYIDEEVLQYVEIDLCEDAVWNKKGFKTKYEYMIDRFDMVNMNYRKVKQKSVHESGNRKSN